jgi:hypothetical protein
LLHENFLHILPTFGAINSKPNEYKNHPNGMKKELFSLLPFQNGFCSLQIFYILVNQMHYINIAKRRCMHNLSMKEN